LATKSITNTNLPKQIKETSEKLSSNQSGTSDSEGEDKIDDENKKRKHTEKSDSPEKSITKNTKKLYNGNVSSIKLNLEKDENFNSENDDLECESSDLVFGSSSESESYRSKKITNNNKHSTGHNKKTKEDEELKVSIVKPSTSKASSKGIFYSSKSPVKTIRGLAKLASSTSLKDDLKQKSKNDEKDKDDDRRSFSSLSDSSSPSSVSFGKKDIFYNTKLQNFYVIKLEKFMK
jgi:hypothetical protein